MGIVLESRLNQFENVCSKAAVVPGIGIVPGLIKVIVGGVQAVTALVIAILFAIPCAIRQDGSLLKHCWAHIQHGFGNIIVGIFEATPMVGLYFYALRLMRKLAYSNIAVHLYTDHENKFMPYASLVERDWRIGGADDLSVGTAETIFNAKIALLGGPALVPRNLQMRLAREAIREVFDPPRKRE